MPTGSRVILPSAVNDHLVFDVLWRRDAVNGWPLKNVVWMSVGRQPAPAAGAAKLRRCAISSAAIAATPVPSMKLRIERAPRQMENCIVRMYTANVWPVTAGRPRLPRGIQQRLRVAVQQAKCLTAAKISQHRRQHAVRRPMAVHEGADVDDHLLAHVDAAFDRRRAHVRQQHDLAVAGELDELRD